MWPALAAIGGSLLGGIGGMMSQNSANEANKEIARDNRNWQESMSNSAHQREVNDLRAAGLNPILSARGSGSGTPTPNSPTMQALPVAEGMKNTVSTALESVALGKELESKDAQIASNKASALTSVAQANQLQASAAATRATMPSLEAQAKAAGSKADAEIAESRYKAKRSNFELPMAEMDAAGERIIKGMGAASSALQIRNVFKRGKIQQRKETRDTEKHLRDQGLWGTSLD